MNPVKFFAIIIAAFVVKVTCAQIPKLDSLYQVLDRNPQGDTVRINTLIRICYYEYTSKPEESKEHAEEILDLSKKIGYTNGEGNGQRYLALYHWLKGNLEQSIAHGLQMQSVYEQAHDSTGLAKAFALLGLIHDDWKDFDKSKDYTMRSLDINTRLNRKYDIAYNFNSLGSLHHAHSKYKEAKEYYLKALTIRQEIGDEDGMSQSYNNLGLLEKINQNYDEAEKNFIKTIAISEKLGNKNRQAISYMNLGEVKMLTGKLAEAEPLFLKSLKLSEELNSKKRIKEIYRALTLLEQNKGNYKKALSYLETEYQYKDSLFTEEKAKQIAEMETRYETEKKEQAIQILERDSEIQALWNKLLIGGMIVVIAIAAGLMLWLTYHQKKKHELFHAKIDLLTAQNEQLTQKYQQVIMNPAEEVVESFDNRLLKKALEVVETNLSNSQFSVEDMAQQMSMSRASLHRKLKSVSGLPPSDFIKSVRLKRAATLLRNQSDTVSQVGYKVGFDDHSYFSKQFKKEYGVSPRDYLTLSDTV